MLVVFAHQAKTSPTLKDNDFTESGEKIIIGEEAKESLMRTVECDVQVCEGVWDVGCELCDECGMWDVGCELCGEVWGVECGIWDVSVMCGMWGVSCVVSVGYGE